MVMADLVVSLIGLLVSATGVTIVGVEAAIIATDEEGTPSVIVLIHQETVVKGAVVAILGLTTLASVWRKYHSLLLARLILASMNLLSLLFQIWQCGTGIIETSKQCLKYPEYCQEGSPILHVKSLLQAQEAMFVVSAASCLAIIIISSRHLGANLRDKVMYRPVGRTAGSGPDLAEGHETPLLDSAMF